MDQPGSELPGVKGPLRRFAPLTPSGSSQADS